MKTLAVVCNVVLFAFTLFVILTEGASKDPVYVVFGVMLIAIPIVNVILISRMRKNDMDANQDTTARVGVAIGNLVMLGLAVWAIIDQYPHPDEAGVIEYTILVLGTPILSMFVMLHASHGFRHRLKTS